MYINLLAKIEAEINEVVKQQKERPYDVPLATKKLLLERLAKEYLLLEGRYKELAGLNQIY